MIFIAGDTHGRFGRFDSNFEENAILTKDDYMIIAGDFGGIWDQKESSIIEEMILDNLSDKPWTTLFIDGNHENFDRLDNLEEIPKFGDVVGKVSDSIFHLKRSRVYNIGGLKFFTFGGGHSVDMEHRTKGISYWERELPNDEEYQLGISNLKKHNNTVDIVLTHTCPREKFFQLSLIHPMITTIEENKLRNYLEDIYNTVTFKKWFCGHFHQDEIFGNFYFIYNKIYKL